MNQKTEREKMLDGELYLATETRVEKTTKMESKILASFFQDINISSINV